MMRSYITRNVCRTSTGVVRGGISHHSRTICSQRRPACRSGVTSSQKHGSRQAYSTNRPDGLSDTERPSGTDTSPTPRESRFRPLPSATHTTPVPTREINPNRDPKRRGSDTEFNRFGPDVDNPREGNPFYFTSGTEKQQQHLLNQKHEHDPAQAEAERYSQADNDAAEVFEEQIYRYYTWDNPPQHIIAEATAADVGRNYYERKVVFVSALSREDDGLDKHWPYPPHAHDRANIGFDGADDEVMRPTKAPKRNSTLTFHRLEGNPSVAAVARHKKLSETSEAFRRVLRRQTSGVCIITARSDEGQPVGATLSSFQSVAVRPKPFFTFNIKKPSTTLDAITTLANRGNREFNIHMLNSTAEAIDTAEIFVGTSRTCSKDDMWSHLDWTFGANGAPLLQGPEVAYVFHCQVNLVRQVADHMVVIGEVYNISPDEDEIPTQLDEKEGLLSYRNGWYREPGANLSSTNSEKLQEDRELAKWEFLKIQEERRRLYEQNKQADWERQDRKEREAREDELREERIRADERKKVLAEMSKMKRGEEKKRPVGNPNSTQARHGPHIAPWDD